MKLYHGTSRKIWNPYKREPYLFVTSSLEHARFHAIEKGGEDDGIIIKIPSPDIKILNLEVDDDHGMNTMLKTWKDSYSEIGSFVIYDKNLRTYNYEAISINKPIYSRKISEDIFDIIKEQLDKAGNEFGIDFGIENVRIYGSMLSSKKDPKDIDIFVTYSRH